MSKIFSIMPNHIDKTDFKYVYFLISNKINKNTMYIGEYSTVDILLMCMDCEELKAGWPCLYRTHNLSNACSASKTKKKAQSP